MGKFRNFTAAVLASAIVLSPINSFSKKKLEDNLQSLGESKPYIQVVMEHRYTGQKGTYVHKGGIPGYIDFDGYETSRADTSISKGNFTLDVRGVGDSTSYKIDAVSLKSKINLGAENTWLGYYGNENISFIAEREEGRVILTSTDASSVVQQMIIEDGLGLKVKDLYGKFTEYSDWKCLVSGENGSTQVSITKEFEVPFVARDVNGSNILEIPPFGNLEVKPIGEKVVNYATAQAFAEYGIYYAYDRISGPYYPKGPYNPEDVYAYKNETFKEVVVTNVYHEIFEPVITYNIYYANSSEPFWKWELPSNRFIYETRMNKKLEKGEDYWSAYNFFEARIPNNDSVPAFYAAVYGSKGFDVRPETRIRDPTGKAPSLEVRPMHVESDFATLGQSNAWFKIGATFDSTAVIAFNVKDGGIVQKLYIVNDHYDNKLPSILQEGNEFIYTSHTFPDPKAYLKFRITLDYPNPDSAQSVPLFERGPKVIIEDLHPQHLKFMHQLTLNQTEYEKDSLWLSVDDPSTSKIQLYPNPAQEQAVLKIEEGKPVDVKLFGYYGNQIKRIYHGDNHNGEIPVNTSGLSSGIYFIRVETSDETRTIPLHVVK